MVGERSSPRQGNSDANASAEKDQDRDVEPKDDSQEGTPCGQDVVGAELARGTEDGYGHPDEVAEVNRSENGNEAAEKTCNAEAPENVVEFACNVCETAACVRLSLPCGPVRVACLVLLDPQGKDKKHERERSATSLRSLVSVCPFIIHLFKYIIKYKLAIHNI